MSYRQGPGRTRDGGKNTAPRGYVPGIGRGAAGACSSLSVSSSNRSRIHFLSNIAFDIIAQYQYFLRL